MINDMITHTLFAPIHDDVRDITKETYAILERVQAMLQMLKDHREDR